MQLRRAFDVGKLLASDAREILQVKCRKSYATSDSTVAKETANLAQPNPSFISLIECTTNIKTLSDSKDFQSQLKYSNSLRIVNNCFKYLHKSYNNKSPTRLHQREVSQCKYLLHRYIMRCKVDHSSTLRSSELLCRWEKKSFGKLRAHPHLHFSRLNCITSLRSKI